MSPDPVHWGFKAIKPFDAEHPIGSGTMVHFEPGDEVPASDWGRAEGFMVEAGTIMRYARNVYEVQDPLPPTEVPSGAEAAPESVPATPGPEPDADSESAESGEAEDPFPRQLPAGWWLLSDGTKVRGKAAAVAAQSALDEEETSGGAEGTA